MEDKIAARVGRQSGAPDLLSFLSREVSASDLKSLLLAAFQERATAMREPALLQMASTSGLVRPSIIDARALALFDRVAFETAADFDAIDLAPVSPFGLSHVLGGIDQNSVLTTIRAAEVPGDCTSSLAVECALRRKEASCRRESAAVKLCASQRVVRLQPFKVSGFTPHFRLFGMVSAGRDTGSFEFEVQNLKEHLSFYLRLCRALNENGFHLGSPLVEVSDTAATRAMLHKAGIPESEVRRRVRAHRPGEGETLLKEHGFEPREEKTPLLAMVRRQIFEPLARDFSEAEFRIAPGRLEGFGYYQGLCLRISPVTKDGERFAVIDGGFTDWTARVLQDRKERLLTSGIGSEFVCRRYRAT